MGPGALTRTAEAACRLKFLRNVLYWVDELLLSEGMPERFEFLGWKRARTYGERAAGVLIDLQAA